MQFLYVAILITTNLQRASNAEPKTERSPAPDSLMMSVESTPLSNYLKIKTSARGNLLNQKAMQSKRRT
jgi:hypothetical protein